MFIALISFVFVIYIYYSNYNSIHIVYHTLCFLLTVSYMLGESIETLSTPAAVILHQNIYIMGGFTGVSQPVMHRLTLPSDLCQVFTDQRLCKLAVGCTTCTVATAGGTSQNLTHCFSISTKPPTRSAESLPESDAIFVCSDSIQFFVPTA